MPKDWDKFSSHLRFDTLMAGVALALLTDALRGGATADATPILPRWLMRLVVLPGALVLIACLPGAVSPDPVMHRLGFIALWMLSALLVAYAAMDRGYVLAIPVVGRWLEIVGARSYALYLVHMPAAWIETLGQRHWPAYAALVAEERDHAWRQALVQLALSLALAELLHRGVERPFMALGRRLVQRGRGLGDTPPQLAE